LKLPNKRLKKVTKRNLHVVVLGAKEDLVNPKLRARDKKILRLKNLSNNKSPGMRTDNPESLEHPEKTITKIIRVITQGLIEVAAEDTLVEASRTKATEEVVILTETITALKITSRRTLMRISLVAREEAEVTVEMASAEEVVATEAANLIQIRKQRSLKRMNDILPIFTNAFK
jgi:hypothetical protein